MRVISCRNLLESAPDHLYVLSPPAGSALLGRDSEGHPSRHSALEDQRRHLLGLVSEDHLLSLLDLVSEDRPRPHSALEDQRRRLLDLVSEDRPNRQEDGEVPGVLRQRARHSVSGGILRGMVAQVDEARRRCDQLNRARIWTSFTPRWPSNTTATLAISTVC